MGWLTTIVGFLLKIGASGIVKDVLDTMKHKTDANTQVTVAAIEAAVREAEARQPFEREKLAHAAFWVLIFGFAGSLCFWWSAVILDSVFHFGWNVADLPTPNMQEWAGRMIEWLFYVGTGVAGLRMLFK